MATEYIAGPSLSTAVAEGGPMDAAAAWRLIADLAQAVQAIARAGIVHRDLKPSNVILAPTGARVIDFGVVQATDASSITTTGHFVGTASFMSPEQARGRQVTTASDVFSLASTVAYALSGSAPFGDGTGVDVMHRVAYEPPRDDVLGRVTSLDPGLATLIVACLDKEPERRPTPEAVFATAIAHQLPSPAPRPAPGRPRARAHARVTPPPPAAGPSPAPVASPAPVSRRSRKRRKSRLALVCAAALVALAVAGGTVALLGRGGPAPAGSGPAPIPDETAGGPAGPGASPEVTPSLSPSTAPSPSLSPSLDATSLDIRTSACPAKITSGATGPCVGALRLLLGGWGLNVSAGERFDPQTLIAVRVFQTEAGLPANGIVDARTKTFLYSAARGPVHAGPLTVTESVNAVDVVRCLDSGFASVGTKVQVWDCDRSDHQQWALYRVPGHADQYTVVHRADRACLTADAATAGRNGQKINSRTCNGLGAQRWTLGVTTAASGGSGRTLVSVPDGFCLDADAQLDGKNGQTAQGWGCAGSRNQIWTWS
jgi:peptidoglycan hydrolase-like protein with peptidoglycan-binding domain